MGRNLGAIAVYCGSSPGVNPTFAEVTGRLGRRLAECGIRLVYGGGHVGLMGILADAVLDAGGSAHGVITRSLEAKEVAHSGLTSLDVVSNMHERKAVMVDLADAFIMLPGGFGTLDEFFEAVTWTQLGIQAKPCGVLNVDGYFDPLVALLESAVRERFLRPEHRDAVVIETEPDAVIARLRTWDPATVDKWLDRTDR